jgi:hypothetical protein
LSNEKLAGSRGTSASLLKVASEFEINSYGTVLKQLEGTTNKSQAKNNDQRRKTR